MSQSSVNPMKSQESVNPLTSRDRFMIENAETGYRRGAELWSWLKVRESVGNLKSFDSEVRPSPELKIVSFFDTIEKEDKPASIMGCRWKSRFTRKQIDQAAAEMPAEKDRATLESF